MKTSALCLTFFNNNNNWARNTTCSTSVHSFKMSFLWQRLNLSRQGFQQPVASWRWVYLLFSESWPRLLTHVPLFPSSLQLPVPAEPLAALWRSRMTRWHSCLYRPDLTASAPSPQSLSKPSRGASPRRRPGDHGRSAAATAMMKMGLSPTATWRQGNLSPSSTGTSPAPWCPLLWRTWTPTTATRRSVSKLSKEWSHFSSSSSWLCWP